MPNGVLSFTLGLETSNFLRGIGLASGQIMSLGAITEGLRKVMHGVWGEIESGAKLKDLSNRTGESVKGLYQLQEAFKLVGLSADGVPSMLLRLQRVMGGVDDQGNKTDQVFSELGLNLDTISKMDAVGKLSALAGALGKMGGDRATTLAGKLFGKEGAGDILQIARDSKDFGESLRETAAQAERMGRAAAAFDRIGDTITKLKTASRGLFGDIAVAAGPGIQWFLDELTRFFKTGDFSTLIADSITMGFQLAKTSAIPILTSLGAELLKALATPLSYIQAGLEYAFQKAAEGLSQLFERLTDKGKGFMLGIATALRAQGNHGAAGVIESLFSQPKGGFTAESWSEILAHYKNGPIFDFGSGEYGLPEIEAEAKKQRAEMFKKFRELFGNGFKLTPFSAPKEGQGQGNEGLDLGRAEKSSSAMEKMGFVFRGGYARDDYQRSIAQYTREAVVELRKLTGRSGLIPAPVTGNAPAV